MMNTKSSDGWLPTSPSIDQFIPIMKKCGFDTVDSTLLFLGTDIVRLKISSKTHKLIASILEIEQRLSETHNTLDRKIYNVDLELAIFLFKKSFKEDIKQFVFAADKI
jgi:hypothetical protein